MKRSGILIVGCGVAALAVAAALMGGHALAGKTQEKASLGALKTDAPPAAGAPKGPIPTAPVESMEDEAALRLTGALAADEKSDVASTSNGIVEEIYVERGSVVEKDAKLIQVDPTDYQNGLDEGLAGVEELKVRLGLANTNEPYDVENQPEVKMAKAALDLADVNFKRFENLHQQGALSKAEFDKMQCERNSARERYEQAKHQMRQLYQSYLTALTKIKVIRKALADTTVTAPIAGYVSERYVNVGERVTTNPMGQGSKIVTLVKIDPLRLVLTVPQQSADAIKMGQTVSFRVDSLPEKTFTGEIKYVGPSVESISRSMTVEAIVANPDRLLRPGMFASAEVSLPERRTRLWIPAEAVTKQGDVAKVFVVRDGVACAQVISTGDTQNGRIEITSGLKVDEIVVTAPGQVHDGDKVS